MSDNVPAKSDHGLQKEKTHKILVVESNAALKSRMEAVLSSKGYEVEGFHESFEAIEALQASKPAPYTIIISSYKMPKMKGDEILKQAREIAPETQRILIADVSELETLVNAVNQAGVHACLTLPFNDLDLLYQVGQCCRQYDMIQKQNHFKRLTQHQNRQLFQIAGNFKKKDTQYLSLLEQKKKEIRALESRISSAWGSLDASKPVRLREVLTGHKVVFSPDAFGFRFLIIKNEIKQILETVASSAHITLSPCSLKALPNPALLTPEIKKLTGNILSLFFAHSLEQKKPETQETRDPGKTKEIISDDLFAVRLSENNTQALLTVKTKDTHLLYPPHVRQFLEKNKIIHGVADDHEIESWLFRALPGDEPFVVAKSRAPKYQKNAEIRYHFPIHFLHAGKIKEDGSIDFRDRGEIPFVEDGAFLAARILPEQGTPGVDVFGKEIPVDDPVDLAFSSGPGTRLTDDGTRIYSVTSGQPHLDALGNVSVCPEFQIKGDLGFETGNVAFDGNVIVNGSVKKGFKVKCASLTAKEILGAEIDITGDLNVSLGIVDTELINVKGSVQAKFIHNSKINAFGDLIVQKEIMGSKIYLSGACINETGLITDSEISAKMGIRAGQIGNPFSKPSILIVGVDKNTELLVTGIDSLLEANNNTIHELETAISQLEKEDRDIGAVISKHAYVQDRGQLEIKKIETEAENLKASGNIAEHQKSMDAIKEIRAKAKKAEEEINKGFDRQDEIALVIPQKSARIKELEDHNKELSDEKTKLLEFSGRTAPLPEVKVEKKIESGTKIFAANSSLTLYNDSSRCSIKEFKKGSDGLGDILFYEMQICNY